MKCYVAEDTLRSNHPDGFSSRSRWRSCQLWNAQRLPTSPHPQLSIEYCRSNGPFNIQAPLSQVRQCTMTSVTEHKHDQ